MRSSKDKRGHTAPPDLEQFLHIREQQRNRAAARYPASFAARFKKGVTVFGASAILLTTAMAYASYSEEIRHFAIDTYQRITYQVSSLGSTLTHTVAAVELDNVVSAQGGGTEAMQEWHKTFQERTATFFTQASRNITGSLAAANVSFNERVQNIFSAPSSFFLRIFGNTETEESAPSILTDTERDALVERLTATSTPGRDTPRTTDTHSAATEVDTDSPRSTTIVQQPVIERIIRETGLSEAEIEQRLSNLERDLSAKILNLEGQTNENTTQIINNYSTISLSNKVDKLSSVSIDGSSISDSSFSGSSVSGDKGSFGSLSASGAFSGASGAFSGALTSLSLGIGTSSPYTSLGVAGEIVASNLTATSSATSTIAGPLLLTRAPTLPHTFSSWATGVNDAEQFDASLVVNPASAAADSNLLSLSVGGLVKFLVDAEGDLFANSLTSVGEVTLSTTTASTFSVEGNTILGDAITDTVTINGALTVSGTTTSSTVEGNFGVGTSSPWARFSASGLPGETMPLFSISSSTAGFATATAFHINADGQVGIGTANPMSTLDIRGTASSSKITISDTLTLNSITNGTLFSDADGNVIATSSLAASNIEDAFLQNTGDTTTGDILFTDNTKALFGTGADASIYYDGTNILFDSQETGSGNFIFQNGNLGIGTTSPWGRLSVAGAAGGVDPLFVISSSTPGFATSTAFFIDANGRVGIGTTSPTNSLSVAGDVNLTGNLGIGTSSPWKRFSVVDTVSDAQFLLAYDATRFANFQVDSAGDLIFNTQGDDAFFKDDNLWICEGDACPASPFSGNGNLIVENSALITGTTTIGNNFSFAPRAGTTTEVGLYNSNGDVVIIFDEF